MVKGLDTFQKYFADYEEQYVFRKIRRVILSTTKTLKTQS